MEFIQPGSMNLEQRYDKAKQEIAEKMGIPFGTGYNGNLLSKDAGKIGGQIGGQMVRRMIEAVEQNMQNS